VAAADLIVYCKTCPRPRVHNRRVCTRSGRCGRDALVSIASGGRGELFSHNDRHKGSSTSSSRFPAVGPIFAVLRVQVPFIDGE